MSVMQVKKSEKIKNLASSNQKESRHQTEADFKRTLRQRKASESKASESEAIRKAHNNSWYN